MQAQEEADLECDLAGRHAREHELPQRRAPRELGRVRHHRDAQPERRRDRAREPRRRRGAVPRADVRAEEGLPRPARAAAREPAEERERADGGDGEEQRAAPGGQDDGHGDGAEGSEARAGWCPISLVSW
jgi:hypothetical protein